MTERSIILRKKLHELESDLAAVFRLPESGRRHQIIADDIHQRFFFLKNLLAAEIASLPQHAEKEQLREVVERFRELECAVHRWDEWRRYAVTDGTFDDEAMSVCSDCALTFLKDEVSLETEAACCRWDRPASLSGEKKARSGKRIWREMGKYCGVFGSGIIFGAMICSVVLYSYSPNYFITYQSFFLPPPT